MSIDALGYVGVRAKSLEDWAGFGEKFLGLQLVDKSRGTLSFRMDDRKQRLVVSEDGGEGVAFFGWEVADAATLERFAARLESQDIAVTRGTRALADERRVKDLIIFSDPLGNRLEVFHGAECASEPFKPGRNISGFRTGPLGMGHAVLHAALVGKRARAARHYDALAFEPCRKALQRRCVRHLPAEERNAFAAILADHQPLLAVVHAESERAAAFVDELHPQELLAEVRPVFQRLGAHAEITESVDRH